MSVKQNSQSGLDQAENPVDTAIEQEWTEENILNYLSRQHQEEVEVEDIYDEAFVWREEYGMEPEKSETYAAAFLSYASGDEEYEINHGEREEFKELVENWG